ncbi:phage antirepressor N-terminal domain-containing protein [Nonomuraea guangzhouensis]|uniref:Phage antirepressor N-terminal domain-containing protein n=1 Tax=Nonomuraea guangzhouensis TaxID=1291555 RepID=A0ABW4GWJ4_9ACTN|nr:phage antirepressor N-terminal domain-containing protein [Nonomuraea guangzhouensis]
MSEIVQIPFHGREVLAVEDGGKPFVILKPALEHLGLDYKNQHEKLRRKSWACMVLRTMQLPGDSQRREHTTVDVRTFLMLLATIDEHRVHEDVRGLLIQFQSEVADVIEAYFTKGHVINPRMRQAFLAPMAVTFDDAMALYGQEYGFDYPTPFFTQGLRLAGYLRQGGCVPRRKKRKYFWFNGTSWEIRSWALPILFGEFDNILRELTPLPWQQPRLDEGSGQHIMPLKRGES